MPKTQNSLKRKSSLKRIDGSGDKDFDESLKDKSVRFSCVAVRGYCLCLGDNPAVSRGVPVSLDWDYGDEHSYEIDNFESDRYEKRRESEELKLPSLQRIQLLKKLGYSRGEITEQAKKINQAKQRRFSTRRRVEREDRFRALLQGIVDFFGKFLLTSNRNQKCSVEPEDDTLASSLSSRKSEIIATEYSESFVHNQSLAAEDSRCINR